VAAGQPSKASRPAVPSHAWAQVLRAEAARCGVAPDDVGTALTALLDDAGSAAEDKRKLLTDPATDEFAPRSLRWRQHRLPVGARTLIVGLIHLASDQLSHSVSTPDRGAVLDRAEALVAAGADILEVRGPASAPAAGEGVDEAERAPLVAAVGEIAGRVSLPLVAYTSRASVAEAALAAGACCIHDPSGLRHDAPLARLGAQQRAGLILGPGQASEVSTWSTPQTGAAAQAGSLVADLSWSVERALDAGCRREQLAIDPGVGAGDHGATDRAVLQVFPALRALDFPIVVGPGQERVLGHGEPSAAPGEWEGTAAMVALAIAAGAAIVRVDDVARLARVVAMTDALVGSVSTA
jgi:dihydropteroate synthase